MKLSKRSLVLVPIIPLCGLLYMLRQHMPAQWKYEGASKLWLSRDGSLLLSQRTIGHGKSTAQQTRMWDVMHQRLIRNLPDTAMVLALSNDGKRLITQDAVWDLSSSTPRRAWTVSGLTPPPLSAVFTPTDVELLWPTYIEERSTNGHVLRHTSMAGVSPLGLNGTPSTAGALSPNGRFAVLGDAEGIVMFDAQTGKSLKTLQIPPSAGMYTDLSGLEFLPDSRTFMGTLSGMTVSGPSPDDEGWYSDLYMWNLDSGATPEALADNSGLHPVFSPDGKSCLYQNITWNRSNSAPQPSHRLLEFRDLATQKRAKFQIPPPWGVNDKRWLLDVQLGNNGQVMAALDHDGNIWVQNISR